MFSIVVGDDQHENLVDDNMPPFTIFMGEEVEAQRQPALPQSTRIGKSTKYRVDAEVGEGACQRTDGRRLRSVVLEENAL